MKKLLRNKRMFLTLIAGMLVLMAVLGAGTFAWFTGQDTVKIDGDIWTATVAVKATDMKIASYDFHPGAYWNVDVQKGLEATYGDPAAFNKELFESVYLAADPAEQKDVPPPHILYGWNIEKTFFNPADVAASSVARAVVMDKKDAPPGSAAFWGMFPMMPLVFIKDSFTYNEAITADKAGAKIVNLTPGSLLVGEYTFDVKGSTIPVYFRVQGASLTANGKPLEVGQMVRVVLKGVEVGGVLFNNGIAAISNPNGTLINKENPNYQILVVTMTQGPDGFWYCNLPLSPLYAWEVAVKYDIYLYGEKNGNDLQNAKLEFVNDKTGSKELVVDIIQATNNAVYMADGWKDMAGFISMTPDTRFFVEYTDDAYGMYEVYKQHFLK
jgi:hypothetical protein